MSKLFIELYLDEDVDALVADLVRARGFTATTTRDAGNLNKDDDEQLAYAAENGDSLWSAVARNRFGSHLRILQIHGTGDVSGLPSHHCQSVEVDYQSGSEQPHSKGSADLSAGFSNLFI